MLVTIFKCVPVPLVELQGVLTCTSHVLDQYEYHLFRVAFIHFLESLEDSVHDFLESLILKRRQDESFNCGHIDVCLFCYRARKSSSISNFRLEQVFKSGFRLIRREGG